MWGLASNPYQFDPEIINRMVLVGCIGAFGLVVGYLFSTIGLRSRINRVIANRTVEIPSFAWITCLFLFFSWIYAPIDTIFTAGYTESPSLLAGINFNAAYMVSYVFGVLLFIDALNERRVKIRGVKIAIFLITASIIIFYFQLLRGDRECIGLILACVGIFLMETSTSIKERKLSKYKIRGTIFVFVLVAGFILFQIAKDIVASYEARIEVVQKIGNNVGDQSTTEKVEQFAKHGTLFLFFEVISLRKELERLKQEVEIK